MPDNDARRQAEEQIKRLAKDPQVVPALIQHLRTAKTPNVRQLAAVLLRKKITGHWAKLSPQHKQLVKQSLIESITVEHRCFELVIMFGCSHLRFFLVNSELYFRFELFLSHGVEWDKCSNWVYLIWHKENWVCSNSQNYVKNAIGCFLILIRFYGWHFIDYNFVEGV